MAEVKQNLVSRLKDKVQPFQEPYQFTDQELDSEVEEALLEHGYFTFDELPKEQHHLVLWKAMSSCYYVLASKHAQNMRFRIENDEFHGDQPHRAYIRLAEKYEKMYDENRNIEVNTVTRRQVGTGMMAPHYKGDTP